MKLYVDEPESSHTRALTTVRGIGTSALTYVESRAAFARKRHESGLTSTEYRGIVASLERDWPEYFRIRVSEPLLRDAAGLAEAYGLRAYDAVHLASAKLFREEVGEPVVFGSWDTSLNTAARREGLELLRLPHRCSEDAMAEDEAISTDRLKSLLARIDPAILQDLMPLTGGVITVMFTDIVNSTKIKAEMGDRRYFDEVLTRHNKLVRDASPASTGSRIRS